MYLLCFYKDGRVQEVEGWFTQDCDKFMTFQPFGQSQDIVVPKKDITYVRNTLTDKVIFARGHKMERSKDVEKTNEQIQEQEDEIRV